MGKKDEYRRKQQISRKRNQTVIFGVIILAAIVISAIIILPSLQSIGEIVEVAPIPRPQAVGMSMGDPNAPVKVNVYSDFQCPACKSFAENYEPIIIDQYINSGKVYLTYHPYRVIGPESDRAAAAAYCASEQNKFWEYHDILFANLTGEEIGNFSDKRLKAYAELIEFDQDQFNKCYASGKFRSQVQESQKEGDQRGVRFTPSVYVNNVLVEDGNFNAEIDRALAQ